MSLNKMALPLTLLFVSCTHDLTPTDDLRVREKNNDARNSLASVDFAGARAEYEEVLDFDKDNVEANIGWVIADLLLLADAAPVSDFLTRCNQPSFSFAQDLFGTNGVLARAEEARAGVSTVTFHNAPTGGAFSQVAFGPTTILTQLSVSSSKRDLYTAIRAPGVDDARIAFYVNLDDYDYSDSTVTPVVQGTELSVALFDGYVSAYRAGDGDMRQFFNQDAATGTIEFVEFGNNPGDRIVLQFNDVTLGGFCAAEPCASRYKIDGRIESTLTRPVGIDPRRIPFLSVAGDQGPPRREAFVVAFEQCADLDRAYLAGKLREIGNLLERDSARLALVLASPNLSGVQYVLPKNLLHVRQDLVINSTDVYFLKAAVDLAGAAIELAVQYKYAEGRIQDMIADYCKWADEDGDDVPECHDARDFRPFLLHMNYDANFLERAPMFDLTIAQRRLDSGLTAAAGALRNQTTQPGLLDFQVPAIATLSNELASAVDATRSSITASAPTAIPMATLYQVHLGAFFSNPIDKQRLLMLTGVSSLLGYEAGDPASPDWWERNDAWWLNVDAIKDDPEAASGGMLRLPPANDISCATSATCGSGYTCNAVSRCEATLPRFLEGAAWDNAMFSADRDWPSVLSRSIEVLFDL